MAAEYTAKVNIRDKERRDRRAKDRATKESLLELIASGPPVRIRKGLGLDFNKPGKYIAEATRINKKARLEELRRKIGERAAKTDILDTIKLASLASKNLFSSESTGASNKQEDVPEVEWWDKPLIRDHSLNQIKLILQEGKNIEFVIDNITNMIEHPAIKKSKQDATIQIPIFLTKKERKKLRSQNRRQAEQEKQEKIKLGLLPKPEPKLKRSNIITALGTNAVIDPSKIENQAKDEEANRLQTHQDSNIANKLTKEQRKEKKKQKVDRELATDGNHSSVFVVKRQGIRKNKFKIIKYSSQLLLTGLLLVSTDISLVVVEGSRRQLNKFKNLMLHRLRWEVTEQDAQQDHATEETNACKLLWDGKILTRRFDSMQKLNAKNPQEALDISKKFSIENFWSLAASTMALNTVSERIAVSTNSTY